MATGAVRAVDIVAETYRKIDAASELGVFLSLCREHAEATARRIDEKVARGEPVGPLAGVPVAVKDALATSFAPTTAASRILCRGGDLARGFVPPYDATVVTKLLAADAIVVGKTNMDELAMGSSNENSAFFPVKNPRDPSRVPGGSSGGSAAAVAAGLTPLAIGSDTGGSIRQPAALTGVVGVKPSYGRVSRFGLFAFASSLDQVGVFAEDVEDAALAMELVSGADPHDATSVDAPVVPWVARPAAALGPRPLEGVRVGVPAEYFGDGLSSEVGASVEEGLRRLQALGATRVAISLPHTRFAVATYYVLATAEASSNLARYDGVRFGDRKEAPGQSLGDLYRRTRGAGFGREVKRRIILGTFVLSAGYYDAYYRKALGVRALIRRDFERAFESVDVIATPTSPEVAFALGEKLGGAQNADPLAMYLADVCTLPASLAGLPGLSVPCGVGSSSGLPVGLQLVGRFLEEPRLYDVAHAFLVAP